MAKANSEMEHSAKGTTWKNHKYVKKVGNRYYYNTEDSTDEDDDNDQLVDLDDIVETPDFENLPSKMDKIRPEFIRKFNDTVIWSPDKSKESLVSKGKDAIDDLLKKNKRMVRREIAKNRRR